MFISQNMDKNKLIRSLFIFICHEFDIFIAIWTNFFYNIFSKFEISENWNRCFRKNETLKWKLWTSGLWACSSVCYLFDFQVSVEKILESWWIFCETLKITAKDGLSPILALDDFFVDKPDLGALRMSFVVNIKY
jgi:hypothetical protein